MTIISALQTFPQLETKNLVLRRIVPSEARELFKILSDGRVTEFYDDDAFIDLSQASGQIEAWDNGFMGKVSIRWGITKKDKSLIGSCGYYGFHSWHKQASIGYELGSSYWRQGIMTKALSAIIDFGFTKMELHRIEALVMPENTASLKLLEKLGFRKEGLLKEYEKWGSKGYVDLCMFALLREDWNGY